MIRRHMEAALESLKNCWARFKPWLTDKFLKTEQGQKKLNFETVGPTVITIALVGTGAVFSSKLLGTDTSFLQKSDKSLLVKNKALVAAVQAGVKVDPSLARLFISVPDPTTDVNNAKIRTHNLKAEQVNYKAQQVIVRVDAIDGLPAGSNFIGKTLTSIDSRQLDQLVKVILPYGGKGKGESYIQQNSVLMGIATYPSKGEKIFIKFTKGISSDGKEFELEAQALNPKDYSAGVVAEYFGQTDMRIAKSLGLTMLSGATDVLTERESIGGPMAGEVVARPTLGNALYHGVSQVAQVEANRQAEKIGDEQGYVILPSGGDLIINLTKAFIQNEQTNNSKRN